VTGKKVFTAPPGGGIRNQRIRWCRFIAKKVRQRYGVFPNDHRTTFTKYNSAFSANSFQWHNRSCEFALASTRQRFRFIKA